MSIKRKMFGPLLKVERADHHIDELERIFRLHVNANIKSALSKTDDNARKQLLGSIPSELPRHTATIIGDAVHNIRVALDHGYWTAVKANGGDFSRNQKFPFGKDRKSTEGMVNGWPHDTRPSQTVVDFIFNDIEPFEGGKLGLYDVDRLDISDKHHLLLPTFFSFWIEPDQSLVFLNSAPTPLRLVGAKDIGATIIWNGPEGAPVFVNQNGPIEYTGDLQKAVSVLFGPGPLEKRPVIKTLRTLSQNTARALKGIGALI